MTRRCGLRPRGDDTGGVGKGRGDPVGHRGMFRGGQGRGGAGPVRSAALGRLVPAHHLGDAGSRLSDGDQISLDGTERKRGHYGPDEELIPITAPEVRRLLTRPVWTESQPADFILYWSWWRRRTKPEPADATTIAVYLMCDCSIRRDPTVASFCCLIEKCYRNFSTWGPAPTSANSGIAGSSGIGSSTVA